MLAKIYRLSTQKDFKMVFSQGKKAYSKSFILRFLPNLEKNSRYAVIVSNKISKKATERNIIKRRVREIIRKYNPETKGKFDIILTILPNAAVLSYSDLEMEMKSFFQKFKII